MTHRANLAVIGVGYWGKKVTDEYLRLCQSNPKASLVKACDIQEENLKYCHEAYGISNEKLTKDYREVLSLEDVDGVHICTPNETHYKICKEALEAGKHVLLEKPMTLNSKEAFDLCEIAKSQSCVLQIGTIFRFNNALKKILGLVQKGYFGNIYYLKLRWTTLMPPPNNRDIIFDLASHPIDIINYLLDQWPVSVTCVTRFYRRKELDEVAYIVAELKGDVIAHIEVSWLQPSKVRELDLIGSERCADVDCLNQKIRIHENKNEKWRNVLVKRNNTIEAEAINFVESIIQGRGSVSSGLIGAKNVEVLEYIRKSSEQKKSLSIPLG